MKIKSTSEITNPIARAAIEAADREQNPKVKVDYFFAPKVETTPAKRIKQRTKGPTKLESRFRTEVLSRLWDQSEVNCKEQSITFRLANGVRYTPDFVAWNIDGGLVCYEVKGPHAFDGALEKLKVAASVYPKIQWWLYWIFDGEWQHQLVLA